MEQNPYEAPRERSGQGLPRGREPSGWRTVFGWSLRVVAACALVLMVVASLDPPAGSVMFFLLVAVGLLAVFGMMGGVLLAVISRIGWMVGGRDIVNTRWRVRPVCRKKGSFACYMAKDF